MMPPSSHSKVVLISGAAGGLGSALAREYARRGFQVATLDLDGAGARQLAESLGGQHLAVHADLTSEADCQRAVDETLARLGRIDVLINNAGITHRSLFAESQPSTLRRVMEVNFLGAMQLTHAALPALLASRGMIAAIASVAGFAPLLGRSGYSASKHAMHGFFSTLRCELAPSGVGVCLVFPSFIATPIAAKADATRARVTTGGVSSAHDIAVRIIDAVDRRDALLLPDRTSRLAWLVQKLAPGFYARAMIRRIAPEYPSFTHRSQP